MKWMSNLPTCKPKAFDETYTFGLHERNRTREGSGSYFFQPMVNQILEAYGT